MSDNKQLPEPNGVPAVGGADHGAEHELEHWPLAEGVGNDLEAAALLDEQALEEVRNRYELLPAFADPEERNLWHHWAAAGGEVGLSLVFGTRV